MAETRDKGQGTRDKGKEKTAAVDQTIVLRLAPPGLAQDRSELA